MTFQNLTNSTLGNIQIRELIGAGGMGAVCRGYQPSLKRYVAVKVLSVRLADDDDYVTRFTREAETSAALEHPHRLRFFYRSLHTRETHNHDMMTLE